MTFKELLGKSVEELEAMTDAELHAYCEPYKQIPPPKIEEDEEAELDLNDKTTTMKRKPSMKKREDWLAEAMTLAKLHGVQLPTGLKERK